MPLNMADRVAVRVNILKRCEGVVINYANYILGNSNATPEQKGWARNALANPVGVADAVSHYVLGDPNYINDGSGISDGLLTGVVEAAINTHFIATA